jgi:outer membrane protein TolC
MENAGPFETEESKAMALAFENRLDLRIAKGRIQDAQRYVVIAADRLGAELTLLGTMQSTQPIGGSDNTSYGGLVTLNLPLERTAERNDYRNSYITLEQAVRNAQVLEDDIKIAIRQSLRKMKKAREALKIQSRAVSVAEKRVASTDRFYEFGRADLRDVLEAQSSLLTARNALTSTVVDYRVAELSFQRDAGILKINDKGLLVEYTDSNHEVRSE